MGPVNVSDQYIEHPIEASKHKPPCPLPPSIAIFPATGALTRAHLDEHGFACVLVAHLDKHARELLPGLRAEILFKMTAHLRVEPGDAGLCIRALCAAGGRDTRFVGRHPGDVVVGEPVEN